jgi:hypothetical protein
MKSRSAAQRGLIREIRQLHASRLPLNLCAVKRSHPKLVEQVYALQPFWGWKRALQDAALDYATINVELRDYVDCKICGRDMASLSLHLVSQHQMSTEEFRAEYPKAEIVCETMRAATIQRQLRNRPRLSHWEAVWTPEYALDRMAELHRKNSPMNLGWASKHETALSRQVLGFFGSWDEALRRIGLDPAKVRLSKVTWRGWSQWRHAGNAAIVAELRRRARTGETLSCKQIPRSQWGNALLTRARRLFGTWSQALIAAGLERYGEPRSPWQTAKSPWPTADRAAIAAEIRRRKRVGAALGYKRIFRERWGTALLKRGTILFGSWNAALRANGITPAHENSPWPQANKASILVEIRRRQRAGQSLVQRRLTREKWGDPFARRCRVLFGGWNAALRAAGVQFTPAGKSPWLKADEAAILAELRRRQRTSESLRYKVVKREKWGVALLKHTVALFGSWTEALLAADVDLPPKALSPWPSANKADIVNEIRRRKRAGESLLYCEIRREMWGTALVRRVGTLFGSWNAALLAARVAPAPPLHGQPQQTAKTRVANR